MMIPMSKNFFEGWYFKHQNNSQTVSIIPGISATCAFIQIITDDASYNIKFSKSQFSKSSQIKIGNNVFSFHGIKLDIKTKDLIVKGEISYNNLTPLSSDIMGPFKFFPMACSHGVISMYHRINGKIEINGKTYDFSNGYGYIEKDSGCSFPKQYAWVQSNDFNEKCSIMAAIADIPFFGFNFQGIICAVYYKGKEYRIATYNGGKILKCTKEKIIIYNKTLRLDISIPQYTGIKLKAPVNGEMIKIIKEKPSCNASFKFIKNNNLIFDMNSPKASCEFVEY